MQTYIQPSQIYNSTEYVFNTPSADYRITIIPEYIVRRTYDYVFFRDVVTELEEQILLRKEDKSEFLCSVCLIKHSSETISGVFTLMGYRIQVKIIDLNIPVFVDGNKIIMGYNTFTEYQIDTNMGRIKN